MIDSSKESFHSTRKKKTEQKQYSEELTRETVSGSFTAQASGFGVVAFDFQGLQNGPNDGIALVNGNTVVEFLSYEGTLSATNGPANGNTSVDIGFAETGSTPTGQSLQRQGSGQTATAFSWSSPAPATKGGINSGQSF